MGFIFWFGFGSGSVIIVDGCVVISQGHDGVVWVFLPYVCDILVYLTAYVVCSWGGGWAIDAEDFHIR